MHVDYAGNKLKTEKAERRQKLKAKIIKCIKSVVFDSSMFVLLVAIASTPLWLPPNVLLFSGVAFILFITVMQTMNIEGKIQTIKEQIK